MAANRVRSIDTVNVAGLDELRRALRKADQEFGVEGTKALKEVNYNVAEFVIRRAIVAASTLGKMEAKAARDMDASKSAVGARINGGGKKSPFFGGAEFGAHRDKRRLLKNTRGRATIVRDNENIDKVRRRVESQTVAYDRYGAPNTVRKRTRDMGGVGVQVVGTMIGWNQFRTWRGNGRGAGYFLFPTIRRDIGDIIEMYGDEMQRLLGDVFPD